MIERRPGLIALVALLLSLGMAPSVQAKTCWWSYVGSATVTTDADIDGDGNSETHSTTYYYWELTCMGDPWTPAEYSSEPSYETPQLGFSLANDVDPYRLGFEAGFQADPPSALSICL